jgi:uncharacterized protein
MANTPAANLPAASSEPVWDLENCLAELRREGAVPRDAMRAGVAQAAALAPYVLELTHKMQARVFLLPEQQRLFVQGALVLAAARDQRLFAPLLAVFQMDEDDVIPVFDGDSFMFADRMLISVYDGDSHALFTALANEHAPGAARRLMFHALIRLVLDGRIDRAEAVSFLKEFEEEKLADPDNEAWCGWQDAIIVLGVSELTPELRKAFYRKEALETQPQEDRDLVEAILDGEAEEDWREKWLKEQDLTPIEDPFEPLSSHEILVEFRQLDDELAELPVTDPAQAVRLSTQEILWLMHFLSSDKFSEEAMGMEMLDGYFSGLAAGPKQLPPSKYLPWVWDFESGKTKLKPVFDNPEQEAFFMKLLERHMDTIVMRLKADALHIPFIPTDDEEEDDDAGYWWAQGFTAAMRISDDSWRPMVESEQARMLLLPVFVLSSDEDAFDEFSSDELPSLDEAREELLEMLPQFLIEMAQFWRDPKGYKGLEGLLGEDDEEDGVPPVRTAKVGRNEPCPCGSGKKHKRCCGAG